jgi:hypothetical protein
MHSRGRIFSSCEQWRKPLSLLIQVVLWTCTWIQTVGRRREGGCNAGAVSHDGLGPIVLACLSDFGRLPMEVRIVQYSNWFIRNKTDWKQLRSVIKRVGSEVVAVENASSWSVMSGSPGQVHLRKALIAVCFLLVVCLAYSSTLNMKVVRSFETSVNIYRTTCRHTQKMVLFVIESFPNWIWALYLTLQVSNVEIVDLYKILFWQHVTSVGILFELHSEETCM